MYKKKFIFVFIITFAVVGSWLLFTGHAATTSTWYAAPYGSPSGDGSLAKPWDLQTALNKTAVIKSGDSLLMRGGTYTGIFTSNLIGVAGAPVTVQSYTGEWAILDGAAIRGNVLTINGSYTNYKDFEIFKSDSARVSSQAGSNPTDISRGGSAGISVYGPYSKLINLIVHDAGNGIGVWQQAVNAEVTGTISYNNGWSAPDRGHGHAIYTQNQAGTKLFKDNVFINSFDIGVHAYGSGAAFLTGFTFDGNIVFGNAWLIGGSTPAGRVSIINNMLYNTGIGLGYDSNQNQDVSLQNNYVYSTNPLQVWWFQQVNASNNTFVGKDSTSGANISMFIRPDGTSANTFSGNTWVRGRSGGLSNFVIRNGSGVSASYTFTQWKQLGYDTNGSEISNSNMNATTRLTGVKIFVRPNGYETGRALIGIYNWDLSGSVSVDLSSTGLQIGQSFQIKNAANYLGASVSSGTYKGGSVNIPMSSLVPANYIGNSPVQPRATGPEFGAFVVVPGAVAGSTTTASNGNGVQSPTTANNSTSTSTVSGENGGTVTDSLSSEEKGAIITAEKAQIAKTLQAEQKTKQKQQFVGVLLVFISILTLLGLVVWFKRSYLIGFAQKLRHRGRQPNADEIPEPKTYRPDRSKKPEL